MRLCHELPFARLVVYVRVGSFIVLLIVEEKSSRVTSCRVRKGLVVGEEAKMEEASSRRSLRRVSLLVRRDGRP